jgi:putative aldouronate transport system substrate-binding protein
MKKTLFALAVIVLVMTTVISCNRTGGRSSDPYYPIDISVFKMDVRPQPAANNPLYQYLKEKLNVTFTWDFLVGDIAQRRGTMIAGGDYPDLLEIRETAFIDAGACIPLEGLIEQYAPRIKAFYEQAGVWNKLKSPDGHIYYLINYGAFQGLDHSPDYNQAAFWIQKAVLKDAGYPVIKTVDQYFDLIANYYRRNPSINGQPTIPFVILTHDWRAFELWNPPNFLAGYPNEGNGIVDPVSHVYKNFFTQEISKNWFKKLNELNSRGLIDRASFTDNYDQYEAKISSGRVLGQSVQGWQFMYAADSVNRDRGENIRTMAPLPVVFNESIRPRYRNITIPNLGRGVSISVKAKDPVRIMRFFDQFMTEEVQRTMGWGIEGKDWQYNSQGVPYRTEQQRDNWRNQDWQEQNRALLVSDFMCKIEGSFTDGYPTDLTNYYPEREANILPEDRELYAAYGVAGTNELMDKAPPPESLWFPTWSMDNPPDGSDAQIALQRCEQTMKRMLPQLILAPPANFDRLWEEYVREMEVTNNIGVYEAYMQEKLNERIREWSR